MISSNPARQRISIAMATYNGASFLADQLASLARQTWLPLELVVTDDRSSDDTLQVLQSFASTAPFPVHVHQNEKQLGYRDNFLKAASLCCGEIIAFCDQDDVWLPEKLAALAPAFDDDDVLVVAHDALVVDRDMNLLRYYKTPPCESPFAVQFGFSIAFRAELPFFRLAERPESERRTDGTLLAHDQWIIFLGTALGKSRNIRQALVRYRQHDQNTCGFDTPAARTTPEMSDRAHQYQRHSQFASGRALALQRMIQLDYIDQRRLPAARNSILRWQNLSRYLTNRAGIFADAHFVARQGFWLHNLVHLAYCKNNLGYRAMIKDGIVALLGANLVNRLYRLKQARSRT